MPKRLRTSAMTKARANYDPIDALIDGFSKRDRIAAIDAQVGNSWQWAEKYRTYMGKPVNYRDSRLEPWKTILESKAEKRMILKARKVTASEQMINDCLCSLERNPYCNSGVFFPNQEPTANAFSKSRFRPAIKDSERLMEAIVSDKVESKSFIFSNDFEQWLYIYGVETTLGLSGDKIRSFALRNAYYDEVQMINPEAHSVIDQAKKPDMPDFPKWCSGTPTTPGNILNAIFWESSDKALCLIKCPKCNKWNNLTLKNNIRYWNYQSTGSIHPEFMYPLDEHNPFANAYFGCEKCDASLEGYRGRLGRFPDGAIVQWVPQITTMTPYAGWHVTKYILGLESAASILKQCADPQNSKRKIYNEICGVPHAGEDSPFSLEAMRHSLIPRMSFDSLNREDFDYFVATVDWGMPTWYAIHGYIVDGKLSKMVLMDLGHTPEGQNEQLHGVYICKRLSRKWPELDLILVDHGYSVGRERSFYAAYGDRRVYAIDSNIGKPTAIKDELLNIEPRKVRRTHLIKTGRDFLLENFEECLDPNRLKWYVPYSDPQKSFDGMPLQKYLLQCSNVYRMPEEEFRARRSTVFREIRHEKTVYYTDTGSADHFLMLCCYAALATHNKIRKFLIPTMAKVF